MLYALAEAGIDLRRQSKELSSFLNKHHPFLINFADDVSNELNKPVSTRMHAIKQLHNFVIEHKEKKADQYNQYRNEVAKLDEYVVKLLSIKEKYKSIPECKFIEKIIEDEYKKLAIELEKRPVLLTNHHESMSKKINAFKASIKLKTPENKLSFTHNIGLATSNVDQQQLINLIQEVEAIEPTSQQERKVR